MRVVLEEESDAVNRAGRCVIHTTRHKQTGPGMWPQAGEIRGWSRWRRHILVLGMTLGLNGLIFLTIPFLSQIREAEPVQGRLDGTPTMVSLPRSHKSQPENGPDRSRPPQPQSPKTMPQLRLPGRQVQVKRPSPPELPDLKVDMPRLDPGRVQVQAPPQPKKAEPRPEPSRPGPEAKQGQTPPSSGPRAAAEPVGYPLSQVDTQPRLQRKVNPSYPYRAKRRGVEGRVVVKFLVDKQGRVSQVSLVRAEPEGVFEQSALQAVRKWRFKPGQKDGEPVPTWVSVPIRFELSSW